MMRVHLRGVVIGVATILSIAVVVSIFNALEMPDGTDSTVKRHAMSADSKQPSRPRGGPRQRSAGAAAAAARSASTGTRTGGLGARGGGAAAARAGGPGARASVPGARAGSAVARAGGAGARARGPGARAAGPGARAAGVAARAGGPGARAGGPGARPGGPGARTGGPGARAGGPVARGGGPGARAGAGGRFRDVDDLEIGSREAGAGSRARPSAARSGSVSGGHSAGTHSTRMSASRVRTSGEDEDAGEHRPHSRSHTSHTSGAASGRTSGATSGHTSGATSRAHSSTHHTHSHNEEESSSPKSSKARPTKRKGKEKKSEEKDGEKTAKTPKKKEPPYPEWWKTSYARSAASSLSGQFAGDQPLFATCPSYAIDNSLKIKRFGHVEPPRFMRNSKNPCWFEWNGKKDILKCLPYFYVAGVAKGATADLFRRLTAHPSVMASGPGTYYWWDRLRYGASKNLKYTHEAKRTGDPVSLKEYAKELVGKHGKNLTRELLYSGGSDALFGDASPTYLTENTQWEVFEGNEGCSEPRIIPASFIRHIYPEARIVILLRDPVERLYSRFLANVPYVQEFENATASLFHTFTVQAVQTYHECFAKTSLRHCAYNTSLFSNAVIRLSEGMYPIFLEDWFRVFPKEQILVLKFEEYVQDVKGHLLKVFDHLGLERLDEYNLLKLTDMPITRKGQTREEEGYMMPETASLLTDFYSPFMLKLANMLGDDKWLFPREQVPVVRKNLEAHEEGNEDVMPATGQQQQEQEPEPEQQEQQPQKQKQSGSKERTNE